MNNQWRFYLIEEDGDVSGTNNLEIALIAKRDGNTLVLEPANAEATFDGDVRPIEEADESTWFDDPKPDHER